MRTYFCTLVVLAVTALSFAQVQGQPQRKPGLNRPKSQVRRTPTAEQRARNRQMREQPKKPLQQAKRPVRTTRALAAALPPTTATIQTNEPPTSPTVSQNRIPAVPGAARSAAAAEPTLGPGAQQFLENIPPDKREKVRAYIQSLSPEQRIAMREKMQRLSPEERRQEFQRIMGFPLPANVPVQPSKPALLATDKPVPTGTPIVIRTSTQPGKFSSYGLNTSGKMPREGTRAPDFQLQTLDGRTISLADFRGKPLVIEFGSITSPIYRRKIAQMNALFQKHKEAANFLVIYTIEAHPQGAASPYAEGEWLPEKNRLDGIVKPPAQSLDQRKQYAREVATAQREGRPIAIDTIDDATWKAYGARPNSAFIINPNGKVVLVQESSNPDAIAAFLADHGSKANQPL